MNRQNAVYLATRLLAIDLLAIGRNTASAPEEWTVELFDWVEDGVERYVGYVTDEDFDSAVRALDDYAEVHRVR